MASHQATKEQVRIIVERAQHVGFDRAWAEVMNSRVPVAPFREAFERSGLSIYVLAARAEIDQSWLRRILNRQKTMSRRVAVSLCEPLGIAPVDVGL